MAERWNCCQKLQWWCNMTVYLPFLQCAIHRLPSVRQQRHYSELEASCYFQQSHLWGQSHVYLTNGYPPSRGLKGSVNIIKWIKYHSSMFELGLSRQVFHAHILYNEFSTTDYEHKPRHRAKRSSIYIYWNSMKALLHINLHTSTIINVPVRTRVWSTASRFLHFIVSPKKLESHLFK